MSKITLLNASCADQTVDAVVNAANSGLWAGGGICGVIFKKAGMSVLTAACSKYKTPLKDGSAVITPAFNMTNAKCIIHAVGPIWNDGEHREPQLLYGCYRRSLELAKENDVRSICFPLISAGIFGYPADKAWRKALQACRDFMNYWRGHPLLESWEERHPPFLQMIYG